MSDVETYFHLAEEEKDDAQRASLLEDVAKELAAADAYVSSLETKTLLAGENDRLNAIVTIKPGAGGTESQDWAEMLLRMYLRWAEQKGFRSTVVDSTPGEEAGIKSATVLIEGENAYGMLARRKRCSSPRPHLSIRPGRSPPHVLRFRLRNSRN